MRNRIWSAPRARRRTLFAALLAILAVVLAGGSVLAANVQDDGGLYSSQARSTAESKIAQIQRDTNKTILVKTVANLGGKDINAAADQYFQQQSGNGVLIYAAKAEKKLAVKVGVDTRPAVTTAEEKGIQDQLTSQFAAGKFDDGMLGAVDRIGNDLRAATPSRTGSTQAAPTSSVAPKKSGVSPFVVILAIFVIIALIVLVMLVLRRNRTPGGSGGSGGGYSNTNYGPSQGGYGPGYGPGYGQPSGGGGNVAGSILGGAAGGIGGAIIGNAIYDHFRDDNNRGDRGSGDYGGNAGGNYEPALGDDRGRVDDSPVDVGDWGNSGSDPGASDWGNASGDWSSGSDPGSE